LWYSRTDNLSMEGQMASGRVLEALKYEGESWPGSTDFLLIPRKRKSWK
jgi:hypothetical protein